LPFARLVPIVGIVPPQYWHFLHGGLTALVAFGLLVSGVLSGFIVIYTKEFRLSPFSVQKDL
jgi:hypothetical protein